LPHMYKNRWGRIIAISSNHEKPSPAYSYNLGKAARTQAILLSSNQVWGKGVTMNVMAPGPVSEIKTFEEAINQCSHKEEWKNRNNVSPQDIAEGISFLCSDAGQYINGCVIPFSFRL
jgi:NAD(P)-dependent dehydrogenase (short-subunit alcohol dehydrogenase family)